VLVGEAASRFGAQFIGLREPQPANGTRAIDMSFTDAMLERRAAKARHAARISSRSVSQKAASRRC
jgi:hypothetical protein